MLAPIPGFAIPCRHLRAPIFHRTILGAEGFMSKGIRIALRLALSVVLFSAIAMAHPSRNNADKGEHHSRLAKLAFWRRNKEAAKNAKHKQATHVPSKQAHAETEPASPKQVAGKRDQKQA